jgi:hypothetical protein
VKSFTLSGNCVDSPRSPHVRFGSLADICAATIDVRFTPDSGRKSGHALMVMSALPSKADMCSARDDVG